MWVCLVNHYFQFVVCHIHNQLHTQFKSLIKRFWFTRIHLEWEGNKFSRKTYGHSGLSIPVCAIGEIVHRYSHVQPGLTLLRTLRILLNVTQESVCKETGLFTTKSIMRGNCNCDLNTSEKSVKLVWKCTKTLMWRLWSRNVWNLSDLWEILAQLC